MNDSATPSRILAAFAPAVALSSVVVWLDDPMYRFLILVLSLPLHVRGAAITVGLELPRTARGGLRWTHYLLSFTGMVAGWLIAFAVLGSVVMTLAGVTLTTDAVKALALVGSFGFIAAAWRWWPYYARVVLSSWPSQEGRIRVRASNAWDAALTAQRMAPHSLTERDRGRGFLGVTSVVVLVVGVAAAGAMQSPITAGLDIVAAAILLPLIHVVIVRAADEFCRAWTAGRASAVT